MSHDMLNAVLRTDFYAFCQRVFREVSGGETFEPSWAVEAICHALLVTALGHRRRQIIAVPPRSLKTICGSVALSAWILGHDPSAKIIAISYSQELANRFSAMTRQVMKSRWYRDAFPRTIISPLKDTESYFRTTEGGFRDATSIGGTLTGKGGNFIIIDDPGKPDEVMTPGERATINNWYGRTLVSRLDNKLTGRILLIMQRLHLDDLVGHVQRFEQWDVLTIPAIAERDEVVQIGNGRYHRRLKGEVLRPNSEPLEELDRQRAIMGSHAFSAQYQQRPIPLEGQLIKLEWFKQYSDAPMPPYSRIVQSWDTATKAGASNDYSVCVTAAVINEQVYIIDIFRERLDFPSLLRAVAAQGAKYKAADIIIEDVGAGSSLIQQLREGPLKGMPSIIRYQPQGDKQTRLATVSPFVERGEVHLPAEAPWLTPFLDELLQFPEGTHDDQVDAFSQLLAWNDRRVRNPARAERKPMFGPPSKPKKAWDWEGFLRD